MLCAQSQALIAKATELQQHQQQLEEANQELKVRCRVLERAINCHEILMVQATMSGLAIFGESSLPQAGSKAWNLPGEQEEEQQEEQQQQQQHLDLSQYHHKQQQEEHQGHLHGQQQCCVESEQEEQQWYSPASQSYHQQQQHDPGTQPHHYLEQEQQQQQQVDCAAPEGSGASREQEGSTGRTLGAAAGAVCGVGTAADGGGTETAALSGSTSTVAPGAQPAAAWPAAAATPFLKVATGPEPMEAWSQPSSSMEVERLVSFSGSSSSSMSMRSCSMVGRSPGELSSLAAGAAATVASAAATAAAGAGPAGAAAEAGSDPLEKSPLKELLQEYLQYAQAASEMLLQCAVAAASGWRPQEAQFLDPDAVHQTLEQMNDPHGLWRGVMGTLVPPGVRIPEFPMKMTDLSSLDREQMDAMMLFNCETRQEGEGPSAELMRRAAEMVNFR